MLLRVHPHPFWGVILLIALRYGSPMGLVAGMVCAAVQLAGLWSAGLDVEEALHLGGGEMVVLTLYVIVGGVMGEGVERRTRQGEFFRRQASEMRDRLVASESQRTEMERAYREVEGRIAGQTNTLTSLYDSVKRLDSLETRELFAALKSVLAEQLGVERCGVWIVAADGAAHKAAPDGGRDEPLPALGEAALKGGRIVTAADLFADQEVNPSQGLVAGPLFAGEARVVAVVVVQSMRFVGFTHAAVRQFEVLLDWTSRCLARAQHFAGVQRRAVFDASLDLTTESFMRTRAQADLALARRRGAPVVLLACRVAGEVEDEVHRRLVLVFARVFRYQTRLSDAVAYFEQSRTFMLFLPEAGERQAGIVRERLERFVDEFGFRPYGDDRTLELQWGQALRNDKDTFDDMAERALADCAGRRP